jgi:ABC-2 type transport system permease protein
MIGRFFRLAWRQMNVQLQIRIFNQYTILLFFLQPLVFSAVGMTLARAAGNQSPDLVYTVIGGGIMGMWSGLVFTSTYDIGRDRRDGTLELIVGSPTSLGKVEAIRTFTNILIFKYSLAGANIPGALFSLLLILFGLWCIGIFLANFLVWSRLGGSMVEFLELPVAVLCGFMYPMRVLPDWMQAISAIFPIRWALQAMYESLSGSRDPALLWLQWGLAFGISLVFWALARWLEGKVHDRVRITGELNSI